MITVFTSPDIFQAYAAKALLDEAGIECVIHNETVSFLAGAIPHGDTWPQVDIYDEKLFDKAKALIEKLKTTELPPGESWQCKECGEQHASQFDKCWNCGNPK